MGDFSADVYSIIGRRNYNEDRFVKIDKPYLKFRGVFDGHGGSQVVDYIVKNFEKYIDRFIATEAEVYTYNPTYDVNDITERITDMMLELDKDLCTTLGYATVGSTACMAFIIKDKLIIANIGDSRAVIMYPPVVRNGNTRISIWYSTDHKPREELDRIVKAGGFVSDNRVNGVLATSRALGDGALKLDLHHKYSGEFAPVAAIPDYYVSDLYTLKGCILLLGSDGLFDVFENEELAFIVMDDKTSTASSKAMEITNRAYIKGSFDNITTAIIKL